MLLEVKLKSDALHEHIARRNISQNGFAIKAEVSSGYLAQLLAGKKRPSGSVRIKLMHASGMDFDTLFRIVGANENEPKEVQHIHSL